MSTNNRRYGIIIIGGGPAGLAPLLAAHRMGHLAALLAEGVAVVERSPTLGAGSIGQYAINSDSSGTTFVDCLRSPERTPLTALVDHPVTRALAAAGEGAVPLRDAGIFLGLVGNVLEQMLRQSAACAVFTEHEAIGLRQTAEGWKAVLRPASGGEVTIEANHVVLATGAHQPLSRLANERVSDQSIVEWCGARLMQSGDVLTTGGLAEVTRRIAGRSNPRVAVIGGSTSAAAVAHALLNRLPDVQFGQGGVTLLHRRPLRIYYPSVEAALAEGYTEFTAQDLCPVSGRVFRFAGFRLDSRELIMRTRGIGGRPSEPRLVLHHIQPHDPIALRLLDEADVVIAAMGYRPRGLPIFDRGGDPIPLFAHAGPQAPMVDGQCRIMDVDGVAIPALFGIGLAAGFMPRGALGGEPSFRGQANGLWLWQSDVGALIVEAVRAPVAMPWLDAVAQDASIPVFAGEH